MLRTDSIAFIENYQRGVGRGWDGINIHIYSPLLSSTLDRLDRLQWFCSIGWVLRLIVSFTGCFILLIDHIFMGVV